jgi:hypothetical protein
MVEGIDIISAFPSTSIAFCDLHKSMVTLIFFFFTMGKAYEWKGLQECNARYRLILNSHFGNAPTLGLYIGLDILVEDDCHFYYITKLKEKDMGQCLLVNIVVNNSFWG